MSFYFQGVLVIDKSCCEVKATTELFHIAADYGYGIQIGWVNISPDFLRLAVKTVTDEERGRDRKAIQFNLLSTPVDCDADEIFHEFDDIKLQIEPKRSTIFQFLKRIYELPYVLSIHLILSCGAPSLEGLKKEETTIDGVISFILKGVGESMNEWFYVTKR